MTDQEAVTYRFGPFLLDVPRRLLLRANEVTPLGEKVFQMLLLLLRAGGAVVSRETFAAELWPDDDVSDANMAQHIFMLRHALGENARDHTFVVTVPGKGYRFAACAEEKRGLAMKGACEKCGTPLPEDRIAFICSYECTFCQECRGSMERCPNCGGELVQRPRRSTAPALV
jgi:DNA-binding winged helix-turn-helix (wHTH) protein